jgi:hypothetical protein
MCDATNITSITLNKIIENVNEKSVSVFDTQ